MRITSETAMELTEVLNDIRKELFEGRKLENYTFNEWKRKMKDRRETAMFSTAILHNLFFIRVLI